VPFAMSKVGLPAGLILLLSGALLPEYSLWLLVRAMRSMGGGNASGAGAGGGVGVGGASFETLCTSLLGRRGQMAAVASLLGMCYLAAVAYTVLGARLASELAVAAPDATTRGLFALGFGCAALPLCLFRKLSALRHVNTLGAVSAVLLCGTVTWFGVSQPKPRSELRMVPETWVDLCFGLSFFLIAFVCHFTVFPVHAELTRPTAGRMRRVTRFTTLFGFVVYTVVAVAGFVHAGDDTCDSILSNLPAWDPVVLVGRIALLLTLFFSYPLLILPCRKCVASLALCTLGINADFENNTRRHVVVTVALVASCTAFGAFVPTIAVVLSLGGATVAVIIAITLPGLLGYRADRIKEKTNWPAALLVVFSVVLGLLSTTASLMSAGNEPCSKQRGEVARAVPPE